MSAFERSPLEMLMEIQNQITTDATLRHDSELMLAESETRITYLQTLYEEEKRTTKQLQRRIQLLEFALAEERKIKLQPCSIDDGKENNNINEMLPLPLKFKPFHLSNNHTAKKLMSDYLQKIKYSDELVDVHLNALNFGVKNLIVNEDIKMRPMEIQEVKEQIMEFHDEEQNDAKKRRKGDSDTSEQLPILMVGEKSISEHINPLKNEKMELDDLSDKILMERCESYLVAKEKEIEEKILSKVKEIEETSLEKVEATLKEKTVSPTNETVKEEDNEMKKEVNEKEGEKESETRRPMAEKENDESMD